MRQIPDPLQLLLMRRVGINERSVKRHRTDLMRKLAVKSLAELVQLAVEAGAHGAD